MIGATGWNMERAIHMTYLTPIACKGRYVEQAITSEALILDDLPCASLFH